MAGYVPTPKDSLDAQARSLLRLGARPTSASALTKSNGSVAITGKGVAGSTSVSGGSI